nr:hypothetical protein [Chelativorans sp.]
MFDHQADEFDLLMCRRVVRDELCEGIVDGFPIQSDERADEASEAVARLFDALDFCRSRDTRVHEQPLKFRHIICRQRPSLAQLVEHLIAAQAAQEMPRLCLEAHEIRFAHLRQVDLFTSANLVGEVGLDDLLRAFFDVLDEIAQPQPDELQERHRHAFPALSGPLFS